VFGTGDPKLVIVIVKGELIVPSVTDCAFPEVMAIDGIALFDNVILSGESA
jgi:hypothetical protein